MTDAGSELQTLATMKSRQYAASGQTTTKKVRGSPPFLSLFFATFIHTSSSSVPMHSHSHSRQVQQNPAAAIFCCFELPLHYGVDSLHSAILDSNLRLPQKMLDMTTFLFESTTELIACFEFSAENLKQLCVCVCVCVCACECVTKAKEMHTNAQSCAALTVYSPLNNKKTKQSNDTHANYYCNTNRYIVSACDEERTDCGRQRPAYCGQRW